MRKKAIDKFIGFPLTPLRFELAVRLLNLGTAGKPPENIRHHLAQIYQKLEKTEIARPLLEDVEALVQEVSAATEMGRPFADTLDELMFQLWSLSEHKTVDDELREKIQGHIGVWRDHIFSFRDLDEFCERLQKSLPEEDFAAELDNARQAISKGYAPDDIIMDTPAKQLLWGAHSVYLMFNPDQMARWQGGRSTRNFGASQLWRQLTQSHNVKYLRALFGSHIFNLLRKNDILVGWGAPGSWFKYQPQPAPGRVFGDLLYSMIVGFDHARACVVHEISHAVQSRGMPRVIQALNAKMAELETKVQLKFATNEDRVELELLKMEKTYRAHFLNALEDNCVNRFTENIGQVFGQDYGYSLNYFYTVAGDVGRRYAGFEDPYTEDHPVNRFRNLCYIGSRIFLANNGLFPNTLEGWASVKARPNWVSGRDKFDPEMLLVGEKAFMQYIDMCEEVEYMFPPVRDLAAGPEKYGAKAEEYSQKRFEKIWEIWDLFAAPLVQQMLDARKKQIEEQQKQAEEEPPKPPEQPQPPQEQEDKKDEKPDQNSGSGSDQDKTDQSPESDNARPGQDLPPQPQEDYKPPEGVDDSDVEAVDADVEGAEEEESDPGEQDKGEEEAQKEETEQQPEQPDEQAEEDASGEEGAQDSRSGGSDARKEGESEQEEKEESGEEETEGKEEQEGDTGGENEGEESSQPEEEPAPEEQIAPISDEEQPGGEDESEPLPEIVPPEEGEEAEEKNVQTIIEQEEVEDPEDADIVFDEEELKPEKVQTPETEKQESEDSAEDDEGGEQGGEKGGDSSNVQDTSFFPQEELASIADLREALRQAQMQEEQQGQEEKEPRHRESQEDKQYQPNFSHPESMDLDDLAQGSWDDFARRVSMHAPIIAMMAGALRKLKDAQLKIIYEISKKHTLTPPGGDLRRYDSKRADALFKKLASQEKVVKDDLNMFFRDQRSAAATRPSRVILIDGSRSMSMGKSPLPMDKAIQEAVIDYKASEIAGYDTYIVMYGPLNPIVIAQPGDNPVLIGKNIEQVRGGLNTATHVAPGILQTIALIASRNKYEEAYTGFTNFVIYSDGDIDDPLQTMTLIQKIIEFAPKTTFDFVLITPLQRTAIDQMLIRLQFGHPLHQVGVVRGDSGRKFPMALTATYVLTNRLRNMKSSFADPAFKRKGQFRRLLNHLITKRQ